MNYVLDDHDISWCSCFLMQQFHNCLEVLKAIKDLNKKLGIPPNIKEQCSGHEISSNLLRCLMDHMIMMDHIQGRYCTRRLVLDRRSWVPRWRISRSWQTTLWRMPAASPTHTNPRGRRSLSCSVKLMSSSTDMLQIRTDGTWHRCKRCLNVPDVQSVWCQCKRNALQCSTWGTKHCFRLYRLYNIHIYSSVGQKVKLHLRVFLAAFGIMVTWFERTFDPWL